MNKLILQPLDTRCRSYVLFISDILRAREILGPQTTSRVVIVSKSTQWKQLEFLSSKSASDLINLIVIGESVGVDTNKVLRSWYKQEYLKNNYLSFVA